MRAGDGGSRARGGSWREEKQHRGRDRSEIPSEQLDRGRMSFSLIAPSSVHCCHMVSMNRLENTCGERLVLQASGVRGPIWYKTFGEGMSQRHTQHCPEMCAWPPSLTGPSGFHKSTDPLLPKQSPEEPEEAWPRKHVSTLKARATCES